MFYFIVVSIYTGSSRHGLWRQSTILSDCVAYLPAHNRGDAPTQPNIPCLNHNAHRDGDSGTFLPTAVCPPIELVNIQLPIRNARIVFVYSDAPPHPRAFITPPPSYTLCRPCLLRRTSRLLAHTGANSAYRLSRGEIPQPTPCL